MFWLVVSIVALVLLATGVVTYFHYAKNTSTSHIFIVNYNLIHKRTGSVSEALRQAVEVFRARPPFDILNDEDVTHLVTVFSQHTDPLVLARIFQQMDGRSNATALKDHGWVIAVAQKTEQAGIRVNS